MVFRMALNQVRKANNGTGGFSLVELCILLAVVMMLGAFAAPTLTSSMRGLQLAADARNIATSLSFAKMSAASQMTRYRLSFNISGNEWSLQKLNKTTGVFETEQATNELSSGIANSGIAFKNSSSSAPNGYSSNSSGTITFNSRGIAVDGAGVPTTGIVYLSKSGTDFAVGVSLSGRIRIWKRENWSWVVQ